MKCGIWLSPHLFALYPLSILWIGEDKFNTPFLSSPLSRDKLQFNCWMLVFVAVAVKGR